MPVGREKRVRNRVHSHKDGRAIFDILLSINIQAVYGDPKNVIGGNRRARPQKALVPVSR